VDFDLFDAVIWYTVFLLSVTFHEAAHAYLAMRGGDTTAYQGGQVTLDPRPHIQREPMGTVLVPILSYALSGFPMGWASAPYDRGWAYAFPKRAAWMALGGPLANLSLALLCGIVVRVGLEAGVFSQPNSISWGRIVAASPGAWSTLGAFIGALFHMNLLLCVLNLLPVPPLDGATAIGVFLDEATARRVQVAIAESSFAIMGLLIAFYVIGEIFHPISVAATNLVYFGLAHYG